MSHGGIKALEKIEKGRGPGGAITTVVIRIHLCVIISTGLSLVSSSYCDCVHATRRRCLPRDLQCHFQCCLGNIVRPCGYNYQRLRPLFPRVTHDHYIITHRLLELQTPFTSSRTSSSSQMSMISGHQKTELQASKLVNIVAIASHRERPLPDELVDIPGSLGTAGDKHGINIVGHRVLPFTSCAPRTYTSYQLFLVRAPSSSQHQHFSYYLHTFSTK